jgi:hypothetical protein
VEDCDLKEVYLNKTFGILQYNFKSGEIWTLER